jgi:hypothetical protein
MTFALPRPGPTFGLDAVAGQPRTERRDKHRAHPVRTPWNRIGLGVDQERLVRLIPGKHNLFIADVQTFCPEVTHVTELAELRVTAMVRSRSSALITPSTVDCSQRAIAMLSEYIRRQRASVSSLFR